MLINRESHIIFTSLVVLAVGFLTGIYYRRVDHILRTGWMIACILLLYRVSGRYERPDGVAGALLSPFFNRGTLAVTSIFLAVHASLVNVPFTDIDLFNVAFRDVDMISHFLGGLVMWLIVTEVLMNLRPDLGRWELLGYSFVVLLAVGIGWEFVEWIGSRFTEGILQETLLNKVRDVLMEQLGALSGLLMVSSRGYPFTPPGR
ncbi:hypothetical protein CL1_1005 [Thermococcus cleftensis]|uniref:Uncharacterized protein n=1 Tax=Thermococcus cleftensis (strain DSM 27260 / KACC 17922 / CL1) TaxID=163003 RepID=I3ZU24_THECF|nr:DUF2238 domain-containing protein [Thermococcus cleftensis]AFL95208.1 hypothetical protein CL1_1005 [Thermococcus cleftensis]